MNTNIVTTELEALLKKKLGTVYDFPKKGIVFVCIEDSFDTKEAAQTLKPKILDGLVAAFDWKNIEGVACLESKGFIFGGSIQDATGVGFIMIRKPGKLSGEVQKIEYEKEYEFDELEVQKNKIIPGKSYIVHDELLATGGTASAAAELIESLGGIVAGFSFVIELGYLSGREKLEKFGTPVSSLVNFDTPEG